MKAKFFDQSTLNFLKTALTKNDKNSAIIFYNEQKKRREISWKELRNNVFKISNFFINKDIKKNDRIAAILPNIPETVVSFLATAQIGAIWSSCSSDFGPTSYNR